MPRLVQGGKYVFGWTTINNDLRVRIPDETFDEYDFIHARKVILISGSKTSGGFGIATLDSILHSKLSNHIIKLLGYRFESGLFTTDCLEIVKYGNRLICWTHLEKQKYFRLSDEMIALLRLNIGSKLLVVRGSGLGPAFIARGPIFQEALKHGDLIEYH